MYTGWRNKSQVVDMAFLFPSIVSNFCTKGICPREKSLAAFTKTSSVSFSPDSFILDFQSKK
jgi:hypothetical protein